MSRVHAAVELARALASVPFEEPPRGGVEPARWFVMGDPQTSPERLFALLDRAGVLGDDGRLARDVGLLSIGDHFDYGRDAAQAARDGMAILRWLCEHPADRVVLLAGNHDIARVSELAFESDESFTEARLEALEIERTSDEARARRFRERFPRVPTPQIAARDLSGFTTAQRDLVQRLLLSSRLRLAATAQLAGREVLVVHAGVSTRELALLAVPSDPQAIAGALEAALRRSVDRVRDAWVRGERAALDLAPLHSAGAAGREGGGLLYHRPANVDGDGDASPRRRFHPRELPRGLVQVVGHTAHKKSRIELEPWVGPRARATTAGGGLRTLRVGSEHIHYELGVDLGAPDEAVVIFVDVGMSDPTVEDCPLLAVDAVALPPLVAPP